MMMPQMTLRPGARAILRLPYRGSPSANYEWLKAVCGSRTRPDYDRTKREFSVARDHTHHVLEALVDEYARVGVVQYGHARTTCVRECWDARLDTVVLCVCGCAGANHGSGEPLGREVRDGLSVANQLTRAESIVSRRKDGNLRWELA